VRRLVELAEKLRNEGLPVVDMELAELIDKYLKIKEITFRYTTAPWLEGRMGHPYKFI